MELKSILAKFKVMVTFLALIIVVGCSSSETSGKSGASTKSISRIEKGNEIVAYAKKFIGTPYKYGGTNLKSGVDCSGFTYTVYNHFGIPLNRVSSDMPLNGVEVSRANLEIGDLVFFDSTGRNKNKINHVGIYIKDGSFIHASTSKGVMISDFNSGYWADAYIKGARVIK